MPYIEGWEDERLKGGKCKMIQWLPKAIKKFKIVVKWKKGKQSIF